MKREQAVKLLPLVNNYDAMTLLDFYINTRIDEIKEFLTTSELNSVIRYQAQVDELRRLKKLRDTVISIGKM